MRLLFVYLMDEKFSFNIIKSAILDFIFICLLMTENKFLQKIIWSW